MPVHAEPLRMRTNVVYFRVMRRLYHREWNWLCVNQHPWQRTRGHGVWRRTAIAHNDLHAKNRWLGYKTITFFLCSYIVPCAALPYLAPLQEVRPEPCVTTAAARNPRSRPSALSLKCGFVTSAWRKSQTMSKCSRAGIRREKTCLIWPECFVVFVYRVAGLNGNPHKA